MSEDISQTTSDSPGHEDHAGDSNLMLAAEPGTAHIEAAIKGLLHGAEAEAIRQYLCVSETPEAQKAALALQARNFDGFYFAMEYPNSCVIDGMLAAMFPNKPGQDMHEIRFLFKESQFIRRHIRTFITAIEGRACCSDKTKTVMKAIARFLQTGAPIAFDYSQEYTYHLPKKVFNQHDLTMQYFRSLQQLHAGNPEPFMQALRSIHGRLQSPQDASPD